MSESAAELSRRERNKADTRRRILAAARNCLSSRGYDDVTMDEIAIAAEVSRTTLFNYFPNKPSILTGLGEQFDRRFSAMLDRLRTQPISTAERVGRIFTEAAESLVDAPPSVRRVIAIAERWWGQEPGNSRMRGVIDMVEQLLEDGRRNDDLAPGLDVRATAEMISSVFVGLIHIWCYDDGYPLLDRARAVGGMMSGLVASHVHSDAGAPRKSLRKN